MLELAKHFLRMPGGIGLLLFSVVAAALLSSWIQMRRASWSLWRMAVAATLPLTLVCLMLTGSVVFMTRHEDALIPVALLGLGLTATLFSFLAGLIAALLMVYGIRR